MTAGLDVPVFPTVRFARILSLGGDCEASHGLRLNGLHETRSVFDWLVTPLDAVLAVLADDGARLGRRFVAAHNGTSVRCDDYGVLYHHEMPRDPENAVRFSSEILDTCRSKLAHKMSTFLRACETASGPLLFLRTGLATNLAWDALAGENLAARVARLDAVAAALARRFPLLDFRILCVVVSPEMGADVARPSDPRVAFAGVPRQQEGGWLIGEHSWRDILSSIDVVDRPAARNANVGEDLYWFGHADPPERTDTSVEPAQDEADVPDTDYGRAFHALIATPGDRDALDRLVALTKGSEGGSGLMPALATLVGDDEATQRLAHDVGTALWLGGRSAQAVDVLRLGYEHGCRELGFLRDYVDLLTGERHYHEVVPILDRARRENLAELDPQITRYFRMLSAHAKLALALPREAEIARAAERMASPAWVDTERLRALIAAAIAERRAFAFIRVGDGEARYLIGEDGDEAAGVSPEEARATGDLVWDNWFGEPLAAADPDKRRILRQTYERAVAAADVLGVSSADRLTADTGHYGYLAWQERWLRDRLAGRNDLRFCDAHAHRHLDADMPFLAELLRGQDVLGVVSPHPGLADALARRLGIATAIAHVVPAEGRLPTAAESRRDRPHFPDAYDDLMTTLSVPRPGCVFLVAAGLLGKVYCARIKALGGIALDIGALADAWMGFDTRDGQNAGVAVLDRVSPPTQPSQAPSTSQEIVVDQSPRGDGSARTLDAAPAPPDTVSAEPHPAERELATMRDRLRAGYVVDFNDFAYRPRERDWSASKGAEALTALLQAGKDGYLDFLGRLCGLDGHLRTISVTPNGEEPHWENWWLPGLDAAVLYGLVATAAPRTYMEIGSGHSTRFVRRAIRDHDLSTRIVSIDPNPTAGIDALCDEVIRTCCEDIDVSAFARLEAGDVLFFDGSHRSFQNSDATVFFTEILPMLAPGVIYGLHDMFLPYDYPESWTNRFYNEQYLMMAYLLGGASGDTVVFPTHFVSRRAEYAAFCNRLFLGTKHLDWLSSSFWMRKAAQRT